jgi:predicted enzyme related to lactoylglutathione lyase
MTTGVKTILYPVTDLAQAKSIFTALLGVEPQADAPYYVGYDVEGQHIGLVPNGRDNGMTGPVPYWHVDDIAASIDSLVGAGATIQQEPNDVGGGRQVATVIDADGNPIGLVQDA